jgi:hypothetical protein
MCFWRDVFWRGDRRALRAGAWFVFASKIVCDFARVCACAVLRCVPCWLLLCRAPTRQYDTLPTLRDK